MFDRGLNMPNKIPGEIKVIINLHLSAKSHKYCKITVLTLGN